jgi:hypothetical protein
LQAGSGAITTRLGAIAATGRKDMWWENMSNDTKSRIMLWLYIFLLCMFSFFAGIVARADTYMASKTPTALDVKIDALKG